MATTFYPGQTDYIDKLNLLQDGLANAGSTTAITTSPTVAAAQTTSPTILLVDNPATKAVKQMTVQELVALMRPYFVSTVISSSTQLSPQTPFRDNYTAAINGAAQGTKRQAAANYLITNLGAGTRLRIFQDTGTGPVAKITATYSAPVLYSDGTNIGITLGAQASLTVVTADLSTGVWTYTFDGPAATTYPNSINGTVGPASSGKDLILSASPNSANGFNPTLNFIVPRSVDGL